jgi:hypothetical protein
MSKIRFAIVSAAFGAAFCFMVPEGRALVIFGGTGTGNTSDPGLGLPWGNAGKVGGASGVFLGNYASGSWVLTAAHVATGAPGITLGGIFYAGVAGSGVRVLNPDNSPTDLQLFRITGAPALPTISLASARPAVGAVMTAIGFGKVEGAFKRWDVSVVAGAANDVWTETVDVGASDYVGHAVVNGGGLQRWGEMFYRGNTLTFDIGTGTTAAITTSFDPINGSTVGVGGDSGGPLFYSDAGGWKLGGIFGSLAKLNSPDNPPADTVATGKNFNTNLFHLNLSSDIVVYNGFISSVLAIPEPAAWAWVAGIAAMGCAAGRRPGRGRGARAGASAPEKAGR